MSSDAKRCGVLCAVLLFSLAAWSETQYSKIDDSTRIDDGNVGWGSCVSCAGGGNNHATISSSPFHTRPSMDGGSRDFYINGAAYSNGLWWYKVGANNAATHFKSDFWLKVNANTKYAQALEFDTFQFIRGRQYMFGTQCDYASGAWDVWNAAAKRWTGSTVPCKRFDPNSWYHVTFTFHRTSDAYEHYDNLTLVQYNSLGRKVSQVTYAFNKTFLSGRTPPNWGDDVGVQFQMDIGSSAAVMQEWVDQVSLTAW